MQHSTDELFTIFFSTVFESSTISSFAQKRASFFKRYMPVSTLYFCFHDKNKLFKIAEYINHTSVSFPDQLTIPDDTLKRLHREEHFFSGDLYAIKNFTGEENCVFAEYRNSIFKNVESSSVYIPIKHHVSEDIYIYLSLVGIGKNRYTQEHINICTFLQPMIIDTFNSILLYNDSVTLKNIFNAEQESVTPKGIKEKLGSAQSDAAFPTLDDVIITHIKGAILRSNGKIAGPNGAASLLGLNTSTLWSKIRKYDIDPKTITAG